MLKKVLKYDFKNLVKPLVSAYIVLLGMTILNYIFDLLGNSFKAFHNVPILPFIIIGMIILLVFTFFVNIRYFYQEFVSESAYLTNTLPVNKSTLIISKLILIFVTIFLSGLVVVGITTLLLWQYNLLGTVSELIVYLIHSIFQNELSINLVIGLSIIILLIGYMFQNLMILLSISLGQLRNSSKVATSFVSWIFLYLVYQFISLIIMGATGFISSTFLEGLMAEITPVWVIITTISIISALWLIGCIIMTFIMNKILTNKLNLE